MTVHDLAAHRRKRARRPWSFAVLAAIACGAMCLGGAAIIAFGPRPPTARWSRDPRDPVATAPTGACLANVASVGAVDCPFDPVTDAGTTTALDWASLFERGHACVRAGSQPLPTGEVIPCDPLVSPESAPIAPRFPAGTRVEVLLSLGEDEMTRGLPAVALLRPPDAPRPVRFEDLGAYGVDSGTGAFLDRATGEWLATHVLTTPSLFDVMQANGYPPADTVSLCVDPRTGEAVTAFRTGLGDGVYTTYAGYRASGELVALITDFGVVETRPAPE